MDSLDSVLSDTLIVVGLLIALCEQSRWFS